MAADTDDEELSELSAVVAGEDMSVEPVLTASATSVDNTGTSVRTTSISTPDPGQVLGAVGAMITKQANIATNKTATPNTATTTQTPLPEFQVNGVRNNSAYPITAVRLGRHVIEKNTAYDFLSMYRAAAKDGIVLVINSAFRSYEEQAKLYAERVNPDGTLTAAGKLKGVAGKPGNGPHQRGTALDISTGMTVKQLAAQQFSPTFIWLTDHAGTYGFVRTVPTEPWHWEHPSDRIVAPIAAEDNLLSLVNTQASGATAIQAGKVDASLFLDKVVHDTLKAYERSAMMTRTNRQLLYANMGRDAIFRGAGISTKAARYTQRRNVAVVQTPEYEEKTVDVMTFNFDTGLWGDGGNV